ncbi:MAG: hypothetical protein AB8F65_00625 [Woeseiaceae bacterium]
MKAWITSGSIVDLMLIVVALEIGALITYRMITGKGLAPLAILLNIGAGGSLMVALKLKYIEASWHWIAASLIAALLFHVSDLAYRWQQSAATKS